MKICVAVSGGVDSLYALYSLWQEGHELIALHGSFLETRPDLSLLQKQCNDWNIPLYIEDFRDVFYQKVIKSFALAHAQLLTPNPCAHCNRDIKFGLLFDRAKELGAEYLATGHYVKTVQSPYISNSSEDFLLSSALDNTKDQSYFLALVEKEKLQKAIFPLALKKKDEIRTILQESNIAVPIPKESQEICFVPQDNHTAFIEEIAIKEKIKLLGKGKIKLLQEAEDTELEIKGFYKRNQYHKGLWHYTEGQRKGLGIAWKNPLYVIDRNKEENILVVGSVKHLNAKNCKANEPNFFVPYELWQKDKLFVRTRFRQKMLPAIVDYSYENKEFQVEFKDDDSLVAKGQVLAIYDENNILLAGAIFS